VVTRRAIWLIASIAVLGLASCSDRTPFRSLMPLSPGWSPLGAPTPPTPATPGGPADSLLEANRTLWSASGINSYRYRFRWECYCSEDYVRIVDIVVVDGAVVSVLDASTGRPVSKEVAAYYRTIDGLFDFVRGAIDYPASSVRSVYDANLGYPVETDVDYVANAIDDELRFRVFGRSPLPRQ